LDVALLVNNDSIVFQSMATSNAAKQPNGGRTPYCGLTSFVCGLPQTLSWIWSGLHLLCMMICFI